MSGNIWPPVGVVVLNYNGHEDTRACLASLRAATYPALRVIVVDNGSARPGIETVVAEFPGVTLLCAAENLGFSAGTNVGIRQALRDGAEYVVALNNDTVVDPGFLQPLVTAMVADPSIGAASGTVLVLDGGQKTERVWYAGGKISKLRAEAITKGVGRRFNPTPVGTVAETSFVSGCFLALPRKTTEDVGLLDEAFFFGVEDLDFSWRLSERGFRLAFVPSSVIWHLGGGSRALNGEDTYRAYLSKILLMKKHLGKLRFSLWLASFSAFLLLVGIPRAWWRLPRLGLYRAASSDELSYQRLRVLARAIWLSVWNAWAGNFDTKATPRTVRRNAGED